MNCANCGASAAKLYELGAKRIPLCTDCYKKLYGSSPSETKTGDSVMSCPVCGTTYEEFLRTGLVGCADCYTAFRKVLAPTIRAFQGNCPEALLRPAQTDRDAQRPGVGGRYDEVRRLAAEIAEARKQLEEAEGDETECERLREKIAALNRRLTGEHA